MYRVVVERFGGPEVLRIVEEPTPEPGRGQVLVRLTSIGMNHAELMQRRGQYKAWSGEPPFTPGLEGGGVIERVGEGVTERRVGQRVSLGLAATRRGMGGEGDAGSYRSHFVAAAAETVIAPEGIEDRMLGAMWLAYMTAWGCLVWRQGVGRGQRVLIPAASSGVGLAASQVAKELGAETIGLTTSPRKVEKLRAMDEARFDHIVLTRERDWYAEVKRITGGEGCEVIFDPVAAGAFLEREIRLLRRGGTIWVYGLLGEPDAVNVAMLILKRGSIRGWAVAELAEAEQREAAERGYRHVLERVADGRYRLPVAATFPLREARRAHEEMEKGEHIGKMVLIP